MSWDTRSASISVSTDNGGGALQERAEALLTEFEARLSDLCAEYSNDAIMVVYCG